MTDIALSSTRTEANVLVVDDERMMADLEAEWVDEKWSCETAYRGEEAIEKVNGKYDIVLLDRQMPDVSGEQVLESIREATDQVQVMIVSGVQPDFDILGLPFDDYLRKPITRPNLQEAIEGLLVRRTYKRPIQEFFSATAKIQLLESVKSDSALAEDERYLSLRAKADELRQAADATLGRMTEHVSELHDVEADD